VEVPGRLIDLLDESAALDVGERDYERWRVTQRGVEALLERWPDQPERAARSVSARDWLQERIGGPPVLACQHDAVLLGVPPGFPASVPAQGLQGSLRAFGEALRQLHRMDPADLERRLTLDDLFTQAADRVQRGLVSTSSLRPAYRRYSPERLLELARSSIVDDGRPNAPVVTHGAASLVNLFVDGDQPTGWLRLDSLAVADRQRDLARVTKRLAEQFGGEALVIFFEAYGSEPDIRRLDAFALLDELLP
jgi:aminoglycoside 3'-phosphotransferase-2